MDIYLEDVAGASGSKDIFLSDPTVIAGGAASITGAGQIASAEAIGQPDVAATVATAGIASAEALGLPGIAAIVGATGIASGQAVGTPLVTAVAVPATGSWRKLSAAPVRHVVRARGIESAEALGRPGIAAVPMPSAAPPIMPPAAARVVGLRLVEHGALDATPARQPALTEEEAIAFLLAA